MSGPSSTLHEPQRLFLDGIEVRGLQSLQMQSASNSAPLKFLGLNKGRHYPLGLQTATVSASTLLIANDPFLPCTGASPCEGLVVKSKNEVSNSIGWTMGYLTNYRCGCGIGEIPSINADFTILGNFGDLPLWSELLDSYTVMQTGEFPSLNFATPESIVVTSSDGKMDKILSFEVTITVNRNPFYQLGNRYPYSVKTNWPMEVTCSFSRELRDYDPYNIRDYPYSPRTSDITIDLMNPSTHQSVLSFSFTNMRLEFENYELTAQDRGKVSVQYRSEIYAYQPDFVYWNSQAVDLNNITTYMDNYAADT